jgi:hypothetical protein
LAHGRSAIFERTNQYCQPAWQEPIASPKEVEAAVEEAQDDKSLDRLQRSLIWFAAILIATSIYANITNNFQ